jgi:hypothetical protein
MKLKVQFNQNIFQNWYNQILQFIVRQLKKLSSIENKLKKLNCSIP